MILARTPFSLLSGLLLMTIANAPLDASGSDPGSELLLTDFTSSNSDLGWYVVNDNVMGGRSEGDFEQEQGRLSFAGRTNTNGGGFSSIRTEAQQLDLSSYTGIRLYVLGDGRRYTWRLASAARWRGEKVSFWADFETRKDTWTTVDIPFSSFVPRYRGYQLEGPALDHGQITGMGLMIYDNQDGPFELQLASVSAYSTAEPFTLTRYQWKNRVLVMSAASANEESFREQQNAVTSEPEEFADRDMKLITLLDDGVSTADGRKLTIEEVAAARTALRIRPGSFAVRLIGKDGSVKLSAETATPMADIYALIDTMPMRRRELSER